MVLIILDSYDCVNCTPRFISSTNSIIECNPPKHHSKICNHERGENNPGHWPLHYPIAPSLSSSGTVIARIIHSRLHVDLAVHPAKTLLAIWSSEASFATISTIACLLPSSPSPTPTCTASTTTNFFEWMMRHGGDDQQHTLQRHWQKRPRHRRLTRYWPHDRIDLRSAWCQCFNFLT